MNNNNPANLTVNFTRPTYRTIIECTILNNFPRMEKLKPGPAPCYRETGTRSTTLVSIVVRLLAKIDFTKYYST